MWIRACAVAAVLAVFGSGCVAVQPGSVGAGAHGGPSHDGFMAAQLLRERQDGYLRFATRTFSPGSITNDIAHAEAARRRIGTFDAAAVTPASFADSFARIDGFQDTADFDLLYLMNLYFGYRSQLTPALRRAIESRIVHFKYWYTDPQPAGFIDQRYYWSENHQMLYHVEEYLAGQAFSHTKFTITGMSGAQHRARA